MKVAENNKKNHAKEGDYKSKLINFLRYPMSSDKRFVSPREKSLIKEIISDFDEEYEQIFGLDFTVKFRLNSGQTIEAKIGGINPTNARLEVYRQLSNANKEFTEISNWMYELEYKLEEYKQLF